MRAQKHISIQPNEVPVWTVSLAQPEIEVERALAVEGADLRFCEEQAA